MTNVQGPISIVTAGELARFPYAAVAKQLVADLSPTMLEWALARGYLEQVGEFDSALMIIIRMLDEAHLRAKQDVGSGGVVEEYDADKLEKYGFTSWDDFQKKFVALARDDAWGKTVIIEVAIDREAGTATVTYRARHG